MEGVRFTIAGRVQGVGFRAWTRTVALRHGIVGTVRNHPDGTVHVEAAGTPESLKRFRADLHQGPPTGHVKSLTESPASLPVTDDFTITY